MFCYPCFDYSPMCCLYCSHFIRAIRWHLNALDHPLSYFIGLPAKLIPYLKGSDILMLHYYFSFLFSCLTLMLRPQSHFVPFQSITHDFPPYTLLLVGFNGLCFVFIFISSIFYTFIMVFYFLM